MYNIKCLTKNEQAEIVKLYSSGNYQEILNLLVADKLEEAAQKLMFVALLKNIFLVMFELKVEACSIKILNCGLV